MQKLIIKMCANILLEVSETFAVDPYTCTFVHKYRIIL